MALAYTKDVALTTSNAVHAKNFEFWTSQRASKNLQQFPKVKPDMLEIR